MPNIPDKTQVGYQQEAKQAETDKAVQQAGRQTAEEGKKYTYIHTYSTGIGTGNTVFV